MLYYDWRGERADRKEKGKEGHQALTFSYNNVAIMCTGVSRMQILVKVRP